MTQKKKPKISKTLFTLVMLVPAFFNVFHHTLSLMKAEARLAGKSIVSIFILVIVFGVLLAVTWVGLLAMLFIYFTSLQWSPTFSLSILILINLLFLALTAFFISSCKKQLGFPVTLRQINYLFHLFKD